MHILNVMYVKINKLFYKKLDDVFTSFACTFNITPAGWWRKIIQGGREGETGDDETVRQLYFDNFNLAASSSVYRTIL